MKKLREELKQQMIDEANKMKDEQEDQDQNLEKTAKKNNNQEEN